MPLHRGTLAPGLLKRRARESGRSLEELARELGGRLSVPLAVAGGLDAASAAEAVRAGAGIIIVGGNIVRSGDVTGSTRKIRRVIDRPGRREDPVPTRDEEIRGILREVSTPNI